MVIAHGDIVWVDFGEPRGSEPAKRRPAVVLQENWLLATGINTVIVVPLTSNTALGAFPGNVLVTMLESGLDRDSVAVVSQPSPVSREFVESYATGHLPAYVMTKIAAGVRLVTGI